MSELGDGSLQTLIRLGLTSRQARVFLAITLLGSADVKSIAKKADVNREDIYRIMDQLAEIGIAAKSLTAPVMCTALPFKDAIHLLLEKVNNEYEKTAQMAERLIDKTDNRKQRRKENYGFCLVTQEKSTYFRNLNMFEGTSNSIDMISRYRTFIGHWPDYKKIAEKTLCRGVELQLITDVKEPTGDFLRSIKWANEIGSFKVKLVPSVLTDRVVIADKKEAYISVFSDSRAMHLLWSDNADFVKIIQNYFDMLWADAKEVTLTDD